MFLEWVKRKIQLFSKWFSDACVGVASKEI